MHVSPFMPMEMEYAFSFSTPGERLGVQIATMQGHDKVLDATLMLRREPWSRSAVHRALLRHPWMTGKVIAAIHWEALRLYLKRVPGFTRPVGTRRRQLTGETASRS
jgi:DUF1365 family protein